MKHMSKNLFAACEYANEHPEDSLTKIAEKFGVDRHSIGKHLQDYMDYQYLYQDTYYHISNKELEPVLYFIEHNEPITIVASKFGTKADTIKRRMVIMGIHYINKSLKKYNRLVFKKIETEEQAYWLGFFLADAYINDDRGVLRVKLGNKDRQHLEKLAIFMQDSPTSIKEDIGGAYEKNNICPYLEYNCKAMIEDLHQYNLYEGKSGKEIPYCFNNFTLDTAYLRGMIDGDGHIEDGYFKYVGSKISCEYVKAWFAQYIDFKDECSYIYEHGTIYSFEVRNKQANLALKKLYLNAAIYLDRKYQTVLNFK